MTNAFAFDMQMELGLKLMAIFGSNFTDTERKLFDDVVDEGNGVGLVVWNSHLWVTLAALGLLAVRPTQRSRRSRDA